MTMFWARDQNSPFTRRDASSDATGDGPTVHAGMSADNHRDATVLSLVGHTVFRKIDAWEVWS
jgi:hypothetical protein